MWNYSGNLATGQPPGACRVSYCQHLLTAVDGGKTLCFQAFVFHGDTLLWKLEIQNYTDHFTPSPKCPFHLNLLYKLSGVPQQVGKREAGFLGALKCSRHGQASDQLNRIPVLQKLGNMGLPLWTLLSNKASMEQVAKTNLRLSVTF